MAERGVLVGFKGQSRVYFMLDADVDSKESGAIVAPDGTTQFVDFPKLAAFDSSVEPIKSNPFQRYLWAKPSQEDFKEWSELFITRSSPIPDILLYGVQIRSDFRVPKKKKAALDKKADIVSSIATAQSLSDRIALATQNLRFERKSIGRSIRFGARLAESFDPNAIDADNDGFIQDGTQWMRPALPQQRGMRSIAKLTRPDDITDELVRMVSDEEIEPLVKTLREALLAPTTRQMRNVALDVYPEIDTPRVIRVVGGNNKYSGASGSIEIGTKPLMDVETRAHEIGSRILDIAKARYERTGLKLQDLQKLGQEKRDDLNRISLSYLQGVQAVARNLGVPLKTDPVTGDYMPVFEYIPSRRPANQSLGRLHDKVGRIITDINDLVATASSMPEPSRSETLIKLREQFRETLGMYGAQVRKDFNKALKAANSPTIDEYDKAVRDFISFVSTENTRRAIIAREAWSILGELGIEFGGDIDAEPKRPTSRPTDIPLAEAVQKTAKEFIPKALIDELNEKLRTERKSALKIKDNEGSGGYFNQLEPAISTSGDPSTNLHELIHAVAWSNDSLQLLQQLVYMARQIGHKDEQSRKREVADRLVDGWEMPVPETAGGDTFDALHDDFPDFYAGRVYQDGSRETLTRAVDYFFDLHFSGASPDYDLLASLLGSLIIGTWSANNPDNR